MNITGIALQPLTILLEDAVARDGTTARRTLLLKILLQERHLTRRQLMVRVEGVLGRGCFGLSAWEDVFHRDMRIVRRALAAAGYQLLYSRRVAQPGYYLHGQMAISDEYAALLRHSVAEVDDGQIKIFRQMSPAKRFQLGCSVTDTARNAVAYRLRQRYPALSLQESAVWAVCGRLTD